MGAAGGGRERWSLGGHLGGGGTTSVGVGTDLSDARGKISNTQQLAGTGEKKVREAHGCKRFDQMMEYMVVSPTGMGRRPSIWLRRQAWR